MNKIISNLFIVLFLVSSAYGQYDKKKEVRKDFNKDGVVDKIMVTEDGGSAFSFKYITYYDGRTKKNYKFDVGYSFGSFFSVCKVPNVIGNRGCEIMGDFLFGRKDSIDPSLNWLIDVKSSSGKKYRPIWILGEPQLNESYYTIIDGRKYKDFLKDLVDSSEMKPQSVGSNYYWVDYSTYGHAFQNGSRSSRKDTSIVGGFKITKVDSSTWIYNTANGVILKKGNRYSWVFISDNQAGTSSNEKLRWSTIVDVKMFYGVVLIIQQQGTKNFLVMVNPTTGDMISLNEDSGIYAIDAMKIGNSVVEVTDTYGKKYSLTPDEIEELFKKQ